MLFSAKGYRKRELRAYANMALKRHDSRRRLLIFAQGRTGSTVLEDLLCSTGYFQPTGELLGANGEGVRYPDQFLEGLAREPHHPHFICHVKIYQLLNDRIDAGAKPVAPAPFLQKLRQYGWHIIHLSRRDSFRQFLSGGVAKARGGYHKRDDAQEDFTLHVERREMEDVMRRRARWHARENRALAGIPHLSLTYEDDLQDASAQQSTVNRVLSFIDLPRRKASTKLRKINRRPIQEIISNYSDAMEWHREIVQEMDREQAQDGHIQPKSELH